MFLFFFIYVTLFFKKGDAIVMSKQGKNSNKKGEKNDTGDNLPEFHY